MRRRSGTAGMLQPHCQAPTRAREAAFVQRTETRDTCTNTAAEVRRQACTTLSIRPHTHDGVAKMLSSSTARARRYCVCVRDAFNVVVAIDTWAPNSKRAPLFPDGSKYSITQSSGACLHTHTNNTCDDCKARDLRNEVR